MAMEIEIQVRNGKVKIIVGGGDTQAAGKGGVSPGDPTSNAGGGQAKGGVSPGDPSSNAGGGGPTPTGGCCCAPMVIGPIVVAGSGMQTGTGGVSPGDPTSNAGGGQAKGGVSPGDPSSNAGGGSPSAGGCCCAPVVIGPIVFTNCCSGQAVAPDPPTAQQVTVNPPTSPTLTSRKVTVAGFEMQTQDQINWCWAAVAVSVTDFLDPQPIAIAWTQETLATKLLNSQSPASVLNCSLPNEASSTTQCNQPEALDVALTITKNLRKNGYLQDSYLVISIL
jgi:hypothetical protein